MDRMSRPREIPRAVDEVISARSGDAAASIARSFAVEALQRPVDLIEQRTKKVPTYFRVVYQGTTVAYVRPRHGAVRVEFAIPYGSWTGDVGFGIDGAFGPTYAIDLDAANNLPGALGMLDEAIRFAATP